MYNQFQTLNKFRCQLFLVNVKMVDQCDKPVNLGNFVFDEENHERKSWKLLGSLCNRSLLVFLSRFFVIVLTLVCAIVRIMLPKTCEETTVWVAIFSSTVGFTLPSPKV